MLGPDMTRVEGTAVYLSPDSGSVPPVLLHNLKHNKVLHERVIFLTVVDAEVPRLADGERTEVGVIERGRLYQALLSYGFMEEPDVPRGLKLLERHGLRLESMQTTFFLGRVTIARGTRPGRLNLAGELFRWMEPNQPV